MKEKWNERYSKEYYAYGKKPNTFFKNEIDKLTPGKLLLLGEGEGRNGVYAAKLGWKVDAVDWSERGKEKADNLAAENNVEINYIVSDLTDYSFQSNTYDAVGLIFLHFAEEEREEIHSNVINSLKSGGVLILEAYEKEQINKHSGGPKDWSLLYSLEEIFTDFNELEIISFSKEIITLTESQLHNGEAVVIRYIGRKL